MDKLTAMKLKAQSAKALELAQGLETLARKFRLQVSSLAAKKAA